MTLVGFIGAAVTGFITVLRRPQRHGGVLAVFVGLGSLALFATLVSGLQAHTTLDPSELYAKATADRHLSVQQPLPFGTPLTLQAAEGGRDILEVAPAEPIDITAAAVAASAPKPKNGAYIAIPITARELDPKALAERHSRASGFDGGWPERDTSWYTRTYWSPARGIFEPGTYVYHPAVSVPGYPRRAQATVAPDGTVRYFEILDVPPQDPTRGVYAWALVHGSRYGSAYWGAPSDGLYVRDPASSSQPHPYGTSLVLQSKVTDRDVLRVTVQAPIDVTDAVRNAGLPPPKYGAYLAIPVSAAMLDPSAIAAPGGYIDYPQGRFSLGRTSHGPGAGEAESPRSPIPGYPTLAAVDATHFSGEIHYFEIFDAAAGDAIDGAYRLGLYADFPDYAVSDVHDVHWTTRR